MFKKSLLAVALASVLLPSTYTIAEDDVVHHQGIDENIETLVIIGKNTTQGTGCCRRSVCN